jgi:hypothetical protein
VKTDPLGIDERLWQRLRYRGAPIKKHVLSDLPDSGAPLIADGVWQSFKQHCAAEGNLVPLLISQLAPQNADAGMFRRRGPRKPKGSDPFGDLPFIQRLQAEERFRQLCDRWAGNLPSWRRAILVGVARRLTLHPPSSAWGKRMRRIKGGVHCQRKYKERGWHPLAEFNQSMAKRRNGLSSSQSQTLAVPSAPHGPAEEARKRLGITSEQMRGVAKISPILECVGGGVEGVIEALRFSQEDESARAFLQKYDSVPPADRPYLSIDEICVAAGVDPKRLLTLAVEWMVKISLMKANIEVSSNLPGITKAMVKSALTDKGARDRRLFFQITGILPTARPAGPLAVPPTTRARKTEAQPEDRPAGSPRVLNQPWLRTLPEKIG